MNNLQNHTTSLELSKRLKELGFKQESLFVWYANGDDAHLLYLGEDEMRPMEAKTYSAYLASELGEWLPYEVFPKSANGMHWNLHIGVNATGEWRCYLDSEYRREICFFCDMPTVMAKMLIYLAEQELINPKTLSHE